MCVAKARTAMDLGIVWMTNLLLILILDSTVKNPLRIRKYEDTENIKHLDPSLWHSTSAYVHA